MTRKEYIARVHGEATWKRRKVTVVKDLCIFKEIYVCVCVFVAEEDEFDSYSHALLQYFLAEGVMSGHELFVASAQDHPDDIIKVITHCAV